MRLRVKIPLIFLGLLALLVAAAAVWLAFVSRDIPPQDFSDLAYPYQEIPAEANAHTWFKAAGEAVVWGDREQQIYQNFRHGTVDVAAVEAVLATNAPALALFQRGLACTACQPPLITNMEARGKEDVHSWLEVARLLSLDGRWKSYLDDKAGALSDCLGLLRYADLESRNASDLLRYMTAQVALEFGLAIGSDLVASNHLDDASLQRLDGAWRSLDNGRCGLPRAVRGAFQVSSEQIDRFFRHGASSQMTPAQRARRPYGCLSRCFLKPNATRLLLAQISRLFIQSVPLAYRDRTIKNLDQTLGLKTTSQWSMLAHGNATGKMIVAPWAPALEGRIEERCRTECKLSGLRLLIACQRYERRNGHLPDKLDDLVPEFIEAVPRDPFDGQPLRYSKERRIIWSVGENLRDDGGSKMDARGGGEATSWRRMLDYVTDIPVPPFLH